MNKLVAVEHPETERLAQEDDTPKVGEWYWVPRGKEDQEKSGDDEIEEDPYEVAVSGYDHKHRYDEPGRWLACVVHVGLVDPHVADERKSEVREEVERRRGVTVDIVTKK